MSHLYYKWQITRHVSQRLLTMVVVVLCSSNDRNRWNRKYTCHCTKTEIHNWREVSQFYFIITLWRGYVVKLCASIAGYLEAEKIKTHSRQAWKTKNLFIGVNGWRCTSIYISKWYLVYLLRGRLSSRQQPVLLMVCHSVTKTKVNPTQSKQLRCNHNKIKGLGIRYWHNTPKS